MESLAGYVLRLADINKITPQAFANYVWTGFPEEDIRQFGGCLGMEKLREGGAFRLHPLEAALRLSRGALYRQTPLPLYYQFFPGEPEWETLKPFFAKSEFKVCPKCLRDPDPYYRLIWNLPDVTVCIRHSVYLRSQCPKCEQPLLPLTEQSLLGRCTGCRTPLRKAKVVPVREANLQQQRRILADYGWLLERTERGENGSCINWRRQLRAVRKARKLSIDDVATYLNMPSETVLGIEEDRAMPPSLPQLLEWIRYLSGSLQAFYASRDSVREVAYDPQTCTV
ncbi:MAG: TniQ family protein [Nitrospira sp.]|nr:TniQ family protein [Nitrospira sp.]